MDKRNILFWLGAFMASIGFWMLFSAVTGYPHPIPWWANVVQKASWVLLSVLLGMLTGLLLVSLLRRKVGYVSIKGE